MRSSLRSSISSRSSRDCSSSATRGSLAAKMAPVSDARARPLLESDVDPDPLRQFERWFSDARSAGIQAPEAMAVATANAAGEPSVRMVLLRGFHEYGFVFYTSYESRKARALAENAHAALLFSWDALGQVRIEGRAERVERAE